MGLGGRVAPARLALHDGRAALRAVSRERPDLIVLDLRLPDMDGRDVTRTLRKASAVPIIMLTARDDESDTLSGLALGGDTEARYCPSRSAKWVMLIIGAWDSRTRVRA